MKHFSRITQQRPRGASAWQDSVCLVASILAGLLTFIGGSAPVIEYVDDKCFIPEPNDDPSN